ncbi:SGNH/GDSL hydrolase family protein [Aeromicrobium chenweiae]|uniref:Uncharacterized protein n=1 Tax=Aeromicrobium chenweiae TaxID=2079793 RepID=A0A2S0WN86_9ACTN|nr:SGNH/GDSL hydrolase family protein [Aeromicrobium chenweiae]AWB92777.1 hypothetical protein C3E78_11505 [Aeromicrobium chenweiae]TGN33770.1 SGNH/GDSL hydrolase family protein [Aeromicrobium chenweiae]
MKRLLVVAAAIVASAVFVPVQAEAKSRGDLVVIGDSISDPVFFKGRGGDPAKMWWAKLGRKTHTTPRVYAERGSGYTKPGKCRTTTIGQRITKRSIAKRIRAAQIVVVAAGVNDFSRCVFRPDRTHYQKETTAEELDKAIETTFNDLDRGIAKNSRVIITAPYGSRPSLRPYRERLVQSLVSHAKKHRFQYVDTAHGTIWGKARAKDRVHPTAVGMQRMYREIYTSSNLRRRFP